MSLAAADVTLIVAHAEFNFNILHAAEGHH